MEKLTNKQRQIIRLAYGSKNPDLRRRALETVMKTAGNYNQEFLEWANGQEDAFTNPDTGNKVRWNSLPSRAQTEVHRRYETGEYEDRGGPAAPGGRGQPENRERADSGGGADRDRGGQFADRTELRGKPAKKLTDSTELKDEDLSRMLPMEKIQNLEVGERILNGLRSSSFNDLESLHVSAEYMAENPDDDYTKNHWLTKHAKLNQDEMKTLHKALGKKLEEAKGRKYSQRSLDIANRNGLEGIDADAIYKFRKDKPAKGRKLSPEELKRKFLQGSWADAETKERIREMSPDEFMAMRNSIFDEDEEELAFAESGGNRQASDLRLFERPPGETNKEARLSTLGRKIVRMAYKSTDPEIRRKLVRRAKVELSM